MCWCRLFRFPLWCFRRGTLSLTFTAPRRLGLGLLGWDVRCGRALKFLACRGGKKPILQRNIRLLFCIFISCIFLQVVAGSTTRNGSIRSSVDFNRRLVMRPSFKTLCLSPQSRGGCGYRLVVHRVVNEVRAAFPRSSSPHRILHPTPEHEVVMCAAEEQRWR